MTKKEINRVKKQANTIVAKYSRYCLPAELQDMYKELEEIGVSVGLISNGRNSCEWYIGEYEVEDSLFCYQVYKPAEGNRYEYNIYFS